LTPLLFKEKRFRLLMAKKLIFKLPPIDLTEFLDTPKKKPHSPKQLLKVKVNKK